MFRRPRSAERSPHGSSEHEADAGSRATRGPPPATGKRCAHPTTPWGAVRAMGRERSGHCVTRRPSNAERYLHAREELKAEHDAGSCALSAAH